MQMSGTQGPAAAGLTLTLLTLCLFAVNVGVLTVAGGQLKVNFVNTLSLVHQNLCDCLAVPPPPK